MGNYFVDGILHITDVEGYDHMLFLLAMCAPFTFKDWKQVAILATAFTLGHSISLALAALDVIRFSGRASTPGGRHVPPPFVSVPPGKTRPIGRHS